MKANCPLKLLLLILNLFYSNFSLFELGTSSPWYSTPLCCPCPSKVEALFEYVSINSCLMSHAFKSACTFFQSIVSDSDPQEEQNFFRHACHSYLWDNVAETWRVILIFAKLTFLSCLMNYNDFNPKIAMFFLWKRTFLSDQIKSM